MKFPEMQHNGNYTIFFIKGTTEKEVSSLLDSTAFPKDPTIETNENGFIIQKNVGDGCNEKYGFRFAITGAFPGFAVELSKAIGNDVIVIGEGCWDLNYFVVAKNGEQIHLPIAINSEPREDGYGVDVSFYVFDGVNEDPVYEGFFGAISVEEAQALAVGETVIPYVPRRKERDFMHE